MLRRLTALHRWLGLVIGLQVIAWSVGGVYFAYVDIRDVRGDSLRVEAPDPALDLADVRLPTGGPYHSLRLVQRGDALSWEVGSRTGEKRFLDAFTNVELPELTADEARSVVARQLRPTGPVSRVVRVSEDPPLEYREKPLPAWRMDLADGLGTRVYVDAQSGTIAAIRNDSWRRWDFLWGLHIMDYSGRDDFHHPLLFGAALLALLASATGLLLWAGRILARIRKRFRSTAK